MSTRPGSVWTPERTAELRGLHAAGLSLRKIAATAGLSIGQVSGRARVLNLHFPIHASPSALRANHPAALEGRTIFPSAVVPPSETWRVLKPGREFYKLGNRVEKGAWRGMPIFSLTLEERATCPRSCAQWLWCYGNTSVYRTRIAHGAELETALARELADLDRLARKRRGGFVVRLHMLGDFYSVPYVELWRQWLADFPALHVFGYTAREPATPIGEAVRSLASSADGRFQIRLSSAAPGAGRTVVVADAAEAAAAGAIVCPAQTGATRSCATCGLCWAAAASEKTIAFLRHGLSGGRKAAP